MSGERIFVFGASGHAKVVIDAARLQGYRVEAAFDDDFSLHGRTVSGCPVVGGMQELAAWCAAHGVAAGIVAIGSNRARMAVADSIERSGLRLVSVVHPAATVAADACIGAGSVLMAGAVVNPDAHIGRNVIVNTAASIDHDCVLEDGAHVGPGCRLCGNVLVGAGALLGVGSVVIPGVRIGTGALVGAGAAVVRDVPAGARVAGVPARPLGKT
jgi:sugar O-acyltransferase (sialic acid O-acetyltransferase NeuD family)